MVNKNLIIFAISLLFAVAKCTLSIFWLSHSHGKTPLLTAKTRYSFYWPRIAPVLSIISIILNITLVVLEIRGINIISYILIAAHGVLLVTLAGYLWNLSDKQEYYLSFGLLPIFSITSVAVACAAPLAGNNIPFFFFTAKDFCFSFHLLNLLYNPAGDRWNNRQTSITVQWNFVLSIFALTTSIITLLAYQLGKIDYIMGLWMGYCTILVWLLVMLVRSLPYWKRQPHITSEDLAFRNLGSSAGQAEQSSDGNYHGIL